MYNYSLMLTSSNQPEPISFLAFAKAFPDICAALHTTVDTMQSKRQGKVDAPTRQRIMVAARLATDGSTTQIGRLFHRDHTTVLHALKVRGDDAQAKQLAGQVDQIINKCIDREDSVSQNRLNALATLIRLREDQAERAGVSKDQIHLAKATYRAQEREKRRASRPQRAPLSLAKFSHDSPMARAEKMLAHGEALSLETIARLSNLPLMQVQALAAWNQAKAKTTGEPANNGNRFDAPKGAATA